MVGKPRQARVCIVLNADSRCRVKRGVLNRRDRSRALRKRWRISASSCGCVASRTAVSRYSCVLVTTNSGRSMANSWLAQTRLAKDCPTRVSTGRPDHRASLPVLWAPKGNVSKNKSAHRLRARCSASGKTSANTSRVGSTPRCAACCRRLAMTSCRVADSHNTLPGTRCRICIHRSNVSGSSLFKLL